MNRRISVSLILAQRSKRTLHLTGTQAAGANIHALDFAVDDGANTLNIRLPATLSLKM